MGKGRKYKTFYKYHRVEDLDEMMSLYGFKRVKKFSVADDARLYEKTSHNLFNGLINMKRINESIPSEDTIKEPTEGNQRQLRKAHKLKSLFLIQKNCLLKTYTKKR